MSNSELGLAFSITVQNLYQGKHKETHLAFTWKKWGEILGDECKKRHMA